MTKTDDLEALKILLSELEKGEASAVREGWVSMEDVRKCLECDRLL